MRNRLSLQTWVESIQTAARTEDEDWRQKLLASTFPHDTTSRNGYDEEKCRNVLVRYCAHIPRNYQYQDGVQLVFLVLREHLGDENLDLAGGVLYELIEIDCQYSDDPGAEFQRWKHDHLNRHSNLELPHIPHMTTITMSIRPTVSLIQWRQMYPHRYPTRLSDYYSSSRLSSNESSCIRSRKAWMIDHTMYVSTRHAGTCAFRIPTPKELHEMQWQIGIGRAGKFVKEEEVIPTTLVSQEAGRSNYNDIVEPDKSQANGSGIRRSNPLLRTLKRRRSIPKAQDSRRRSPQNKRRNWFANMFGFETVMSFRECLDPESVPLPEGCMTPHAIFARKFSLIADNQPLPPSFAHEMMPTADTKARKLLVDAAVQGLMGPSWEFRGPFTPQLGFDGGLDYRRVLLEPSPARSNINGREICHETASPRRRVSIDPPKQTRASRSQRGHDWFGLDTATPSSGILNHGPHARSTGTDRLPGTAPSDATKREFRVHPASSNNWFGLDGAADHYVGLRPSKGDRVYCWSMMPDQSGVAAKQDGSQAPTDFRSNFQSIWSTARHSEQCQEFTCFPITGGKHAVPDHRWLVENNPRIHPVRVVEVQTHKLRLAPSLD